MSQTIDIGGIRAYDDLAEALTAVEDRAIALGWTDYAQRLNEMVIELDEETAAQAEYDRSPPHALETWGR